MRSNLITRLSDKCSALGARITRVKATGNRKFLALSLFILCSFLAISAVVLNTRFITVTDGDATYVLRTLGGDTADALAAFQIELTPYDEVRTEQNGIFSRVEVVRAFPVSLTVDGQSFTDYVTGGTVSDLLEKHGVELGKYDVLTEASTSTLKRDMEVAVKRVTVETVTAETVIPFEVERIPSQNIENGKTVTTREGETGLSVAVLRNTYVDGELASSTTVSETVTKQPVAKQVTYGVGGSVATNRGALRYSRVIDVTATAYTYGDGGSYGDYTATGKAVKVGYIAVDPKVIPLHSRVYITYPDGSFMYGFAVAEDTGGAIKGNRIDLFFETKAECRQFGVRKAKVYILE